MQGLESAQCAPSPVSSVLMLSPAPNAPPPTSSSHTTDIIICVSVLGALMLVIMLVLISVVLRRVQKLRLVPDVENKQVQPFSCIPFTDRTVQRMSIEPSFSQCAFNDNAADRNPTFYHLALSNSNPPSYHSSMVIEPDDSTQSLIPLPSPSADVSCRRGKSSLHNIRLPIEPPLVHTRGDSAIADPV